MQLFSVSVEMSSPMLSAMPLHNLASCFDPSVAHSVPALAAKISERQSVFIRGGNGVMSMIAAIAHNSAAAAVYTRDGGVP